MAYGNYNQDYERPSGWSALDEDFDPFAQEGVDLDGMELYRALGVTRKVTPRQIKEAYRAMARKHHPDKGGKQEVFAKIQKAYDTLSDPKAREAYDVWQSEIEFRYLPGIAAKGEGGEDLLLDEFDKRFDGGVDAATQLVVVCEVCRRPSNRRCAICGMAMCDFCGLKRHWKGEFGLHWPIFNKDGTKQRARAELERKKEEDARRRLLEDPNHRDEREKEDARSFMRERRHAASKAGGAVELYSRALARYYMWAQTDACVFVACYAPTYGPDKSFSLTLDDGKYFKLAGEDTKKGNEEVPIVDRLLAHGLSMDKPYEVMGDGKKSGLYLVKMHKGNPGEHWARLFEGDPAGVRCLVPPWKMTENEDDVVLEIDCPHWVQPDDITIEFTDKMFTCKVQGHIETWRTYWTKTDEAQKSKPRCDWHVAVDAPECLWSLDGGDDDDGAGKQTLTICLVRPEPTPREIEWKKGKRDDNRAAGPPGQRPGVRFFHDDHDDYGACQAARARASHARTRDTRRPPLTCAANVDRCGSLARPQGWKTG